MYYVGAFSSLDRSASDDRSDDLFSAMVLDARSFKGLTLDDVAVEVRDKIEELGSLQVQYLVENVHTEPQPANLFVANSSYTAQMWPLGPHLCDLASWLTNATPTNPMSKLSKMERVWIYESRSYSSSCYPLS